MGALNLLLAPGLTAQITGSNLLVSTLDNAVCPNVSNATLTATSPVNQTNDGAAANVALIAQPALKGAKARLRVVAAHELRLTAAGSDKIFWADEAPTGGTHVASSVPNSTLEMFCFKDGVWDVLYSNGFSIG